MTDNVPSTPEDIPDFCRQAFSRRDHDHLELVGKVDAIDGKVTELHNFLMVEEPSRNGSSFVSRLRNLETWKGAVSRIFWVLGLLVATTLIGSVLSLILHKSP